MSSPPASTQSDASPPRVIDLERLLQGSPEIRLRHNQAEYRLRLTKNDKVLLTK